MRTLFTFLSCLCLINFYSQALTMRVEKSAAGTEYLIFVPPSYDGTKAYPLLVYLHGAQEIGPNISCSVGKGLPGAIKNNSFFNNIPMVIIAPHVKLGTTCNNSANNDFLWNPAMVDEVVNHVMKPTNYKIDPNRIFGSGISLGAKGIWDYALAYPTKLAGLVPFSGNAPIGSICTLNGVAVWAFHGQFDGLIPPSGGTDRKGSQTVVNTLNSCAKPPYLPAYITILEAKGHNGWDQVFDLSSGYDIYNWMLALKKNNNLNYKPLVNVGPDRKFLIPAYPIKISSFAYDPNGKIQSYKWQKLAGPAVSFGTTNPILSVKPTTVGLYTFRLTVTDNEGNTAFDDVNLEIVSASTLPTVTELRLYDGKAKKDLGKITNNRIFNLYGYAADLIDIVAISKNLTSLSNSVRFELDHNGNFNTMNDKDLTSTYPNYTMGRQNHKFFIPGVDQYVITATAYSDRLAKQPGISFQVTISFVKNAPATTATAKAASVTEQQYAVFPNPLKGNQFTVESEFLQPGDRVELLSSKGSILADYQVSLAGSESFDLNLLPLKNGIYFLRVTSRNNVISKRVVVMNE